MQTNIPGLIELSNRFRVDIVEMLHEAKSGHPGGSLSAIDLITALWYSEMQGVKSSKSLSENRDRFILSKGHAVPALYAVLADKGFFPREELMRLRKTGSLLQGHPDRVRMPIVEASTGSLGQGLSVAQGMALGFKLDKKPSRVFCLMGDGEIQEGQVWEAALSASKFKLSNLIAIVDCNNGQIDGPVSQVMPLEPLKGKWESFGWNTIEINGHDMKEIVATFEKIAADVKGGLDKPTMILARTIKGKGVSFMEGKIEWHGVAPKADEAKRAIEEIRALKTAGN